MMYVCDNCGDTGDVDGARADNLQRGRLGCAVCGSFVRHAELGEEFRSALNRIASVLGLTTTPTDISTDVLNAVEKMKEQFTGCRSLLVYDSNGFVITQGHHDSLCRALGSEQEENENLRATVQAIEGRLVENVNSREKVTAERDALIAERDRLRAVIVHRKCRGPMGCFYFCPGCPEKHGARCGLACDKGGVTQ